jgi:ATP-dependent RNA helicase DDX52/ROK1
VPNPVQTFSQLISEYGMKEILIRNVSEMGYHVPTPIQMQAIPLMLQVRQLVILCCSCSQLLEVLL